MVAFFKSNNIRIRIRSSKHYSLTSEPDRKKTVFFLTTALRHQDKLNHDDAADQNEWQLTHIQLSTP